jgi:hypothetical protein
MSRHGYSNIQSDLRLLTRVGSELSSRHSAAQASKVGRLPSNYLLNQVAVVSIPALSEWLNRVNPPRRVIT